MKDVTGFVYGMDDFGVKQTAASPGEEVCFTHPDEPGSFIRCTGIVTNEVCGDMYELEITSMEAIEDSSEWKGRVCGDCQFYSGEECNGMMFEGSERYDDSPACEEFEELSD